MTARPRSARGKGAALRDEVISAAEQLLLREGHDDAVSIRAVADAVGVTPPSIYRHFADKTELIFAVCEKQFARFDEVMKKAVKGAKSPLHELQLRGEAYIEFGLEHPEAYVVMFMRPPSLDIDVALEQKPQAFINLVDSVQRAIDSGELSAESAEHAAQVIWATVHGLTSLMIAQPTFPWSDKQLLIDDTIHAAVAPFLPR